MNSNNSIPDIQNSGKRFVDWLKNVNIFIDSDLWFCLLKNNHRNSPVFCSKYFLRTRRDS